MDALELRILNFGFRVFAWEWVAMLAAAIASVVVIAIAPSDAYAAGKNKRQAIMALTEVAEGAPVTVTINNRNNSTGYFKFKTENETPSASLIVTIFNVTPLGDILVCTTTAVTTNTTWTTLLGSSLTPADGIDQACIFPMASRVKFTFTDSVSSTDFDVTAEMEWVTN